MRRSVQRTFRCVSLSFSMLFFGNYTAFGVDCPECKQSYPDFTRLALHGALEHELWLCPKCPKTFPVKDRKSYWHHRIKEHGEAVCFACNLRVFRDKDEWKRHLEKHGKKMPLLSNRFPCCPQMPDHAETVWVLELHGAHRHGSWINFLCKVRPLHECCKPFREIVLTSSGGTFLGSIRNFSKHVHEKHGLCLLCERELTFGTDSDMFAEQPCLKANFFLKPRGNIFVPKTKSFTCFCGKRAQRNAESRLFALKIDRLPFGTGLNTVTHPFYCIIDGSNSEEKNSTKRLKAENAVPSKSDKSIRKHSDEPKKNSLKAPPSPSFSAESVDTTFISMNDKKHKNSLLSDARTVFSTNNEINVKLFENL